MNRVVPLAVALAFVASCGGRAGDSGPPAVAPSPGPSPLAPPHVEPPPSPPAPARPADGVDGASKFPGFGPRPGPDPYPPCTASRRDICNQLLKEPVRPNGGGDGGGTGDRHGGREAGPVKPEPDPVSDCFGSQPDCSAVGPGMGAFGQPLEMYVGRPGALAFAVAADDGVLIEELGGPRQPSRPVNLGRCMRVTLDVPDAIAIVGGNGEVRSLPDSLSGASWRWSVRPHRSGSFALAARVEVLESADGRCTRRVLEAYTRRVPLKVRVTVWQRLKEDVREARTWMDRFAAFFRSWEPVGILLLSFLLLVLAIGGLRFLATRRWSGRKQDGSV